MVGNITGSIDAANCNISLSGVELTGNLELASNSTAIVIGGGIVGNLNVSEDSKLTISGGYFNDFSCQNYISPECAVTPSDDLKYSYMVTTP